MEVHYPSRARGELDGSAAPYPAVVLVQGARVSTERYRWLAVHLSSRGYVVVAPEHVLDLPILEADNARLALVALRRASAGRGLLAGSVAVDGRTAVLGHSLGAVVGTRLWLGGSFTALGLLAAYPAAGDELSRGAGRPVFAVAGANDRSATVDEVATGLRRFGAPRWLAVVEDLNHYDWTDAPTASELASDGPPARDQALSRRHLLAVLDTWLDVALKRLPSAEDALRAPAFPGVTVSQ
jgi:predicted dienelactone hydrolase